MRFGLNILTTFLHSFGGRKVPSGFRNTHHLPNIFARRNPRIAARSARLRATKSAGRTRNVPTSSTSLRSTGSLRGGANSRCGDRAAKHHRRAPSPLRRHNTALVPPPATYPHPPGAYVLEPSFVVPGFPELDGQHLPPLVVQKLFLDALFASRQVLLRAAAAAAKWHGDEEDKAWRRAEDAYFAWQRTEDAKYARLLEQDLKKAQAAHRRAEDTEYKRLLKEDARRARAAHRRAEEEEFARLLEEDRRKAQEARRRAEAEEAARRERERRAEEEEEDRRRQAAKEEEEERRRRAEHEASMERERRECEGREREHKFQSATAEAEQPHLAMCLRIYEAKWAVLRSNLAEIQSQSITFCDIPWPVFGTVQVIEDITEEGVLQFVCHPLRDYIQGSSGGQGRSLRLEMLRWHPDKFEGKMLDKVVAGHREAVKKAAGNVARILTQLSAEMR